MSLDDRSPLRVAILATHPIQYQVPLWRRLVLDQRLEVRVFYGSDLSVRGYRDKEFGVRVQWDTPLTAGYAHEFLECDPALQQLAFFRPAGHGIGAAFDRFRPDVVLLNAYNGLYWLRALLAARLRGIPVVMRHEASDEAQARGLVKAVLRDLALRILYMQVERFAAIGTNARRHLRRLGVPATRIGGSPYCVDSEELERQYAFWLPRRAERRRELGVGQDDLVFVFSGKLIPKKQPLMLVAALAQLAPGFLERVHLIVLGDGEQRAEMERQCREVLGARLHMAGFVNQSQLGRWFVAGDCLVLPSRRGSGETWGLVVNEALLFGLHVIVSDAVGCAPDLVDDMTGAVFDATSAAGLAAAIHDFGGGVRPESGAAREKISSYSIEVAARGVNTDLYQAMRYTHSVSNL